MSAREIAKPESGERGAGLLGAILVVATLSAAAGALLQAGLGAAAEVTAAQQVACARFTALGALDLAMDLPTSAISVEIFPGAASIETALSLTNDGSCLVTVRATCAQARRTISGRAPRQRCLTN